MNLKMKAWNGLLVTMILALGACGGGGPVQPGTTGLASDDCPDWTREEPGIRDGQVYAVGLSSRHSSKNSARNSARARAYAALTQQVQVVSGYTYDELTGGVGTESEGVDSGVARQEFISQSSQASLRGLRVAKWCDLRVASASGRQNFEVYALAAISEEELNRAMAQAGAPNEDLNSTEGRKRIDRAADVLSKYKQQKQ